MDAKFVTELLDGFHGNAGESQICRDRFQSKRMRIEAGESMERIKKCETILASGYTDCNSVAILYHMIIIDCSSCYT